jgi:hypothetical protein
MLKAGVKRKLAFIGVDANVAIDQDRLASTI